MRYFRGSRRKNRRASTPRDNTGSFENTTSVQGAVGNTSDAESNRKRPASDEQGGKRKRNKKSTSSMTDSTSMNNVSREQGDHPMFNTTERDRETMCKQNRSQTAVLLSSSSDTEENSGEDKGENGWSSFPISAEHQRSDRQFLLQQIELLKTQFHLDDCPALSKLKENNNSHIPLTVIQNSLRKVNYRREDELLQHLNRNAQRKLLNRLHRLGKPKKQKASGMSPCKPGEQLQRYKEAQWRVSQAEAALKKTKEQLENLKAINVLVSQTEEFGNKVDSKTLLREVKKRNNAGHKCRPDESCVVPATHRELVETLFNV